MRRALGTPLLFPSPSLLPPNPPLRCPSRWLHPTPPRRRSFYYRQSRLSPENVIDPLTKPTPIDKALLHVVSVPIGNLKDLSLRALDVLHEVDYIVTSDRPATRTLLDLVQIPSQGRLIHYAHSNTRATGERLVELLRGGRSMALVTTSGTPCVGDVGAGLVREMQAHGVRVTAVPGPSAVMGALAVCGLTSSPHDPGSAPTEDTASGSDPDAAGSKRGGSNLFQDGSFFFGNLLPSSQGARLRYLREVVGRAHYPCVFYELPRRLLMVLQDIAALLPKRRVYVVHELTKLNESLHADTAERLVQFYLRQEAQVMLRKGQLVLVVAGAGPEEAAAWLEQEARRRRKLRRNVKELMAARSAPPGPSSSDPTDPSTAVKADQKLCKAKDPSRVSLKARRRILLRRKREKLIQDIEKEQERLRMNMSINREFAKKL
ncbi:unnamed protein product [Phytomonas sp. Hart1]|nr:unnamed protein product [Phytomonas sp. Hart1]|eukprot:CCW69506.1 unnamed protein product [Phytomonas sp. isolate Hart1]